MRRLSRSTYRALGIDLCRPISRLAVLGQEAGHVPVASGEVALRARCARIVNLVLAPGVQGRESQGKGGDDEPSPRPGVN